jgi:hypothetical protein
MAPRVVCSEHGKEQSMTGTDKLLGLSANGPHGPHMPVVGIGLIVALLEARDLGKLVYSFFSDCHSMWDVVDRLFNMDDAQFIDVTLAAAMIFVMGWAVAAAFRGSGRREDPPEDSDAL